MKVAVLHHNDADGFGCAFAAWAALKDKTELMFKEVRYGEEPPWEELKSFAPDQVYVLDFSYPLETMLALDGLYPTVLIDHHKTALQALALKEGDEFVDNIRSVREAQDGGLPTLSGIRIFTENAACVLSWLFFHPGEEIPEILLYVQDRDIWKWELEHSKEINAYIATLPNDFEAWADFYTPLAYDAGKAVLAFQAKQVEGRVKAAEVVRVWNPQAPKLPGRAPAEEGSDFWTVPIVNASENISEVGNDLLLAYPEAPFSVTYCDRPNGMRSYSLRARGDFDVSEVAKAFGGGGHKSASGFSLPAPRMI